jgi:hypothetical protein
MCLEFVPLHGTSRLLPDPPKSICAARRACENRSGRAASDIRSQVIPRGNVVCRLAILNCPLLLPRINQPQIVDASIACRIALFTPNEANHQSTTGQRDEASLHAQRRSSRTAAGARPQNEIDSIKPQAAKLERLRLLRAAIWFGDVMIVLVYNSVKILNVNLFNNRTHPGKILGPVH